MKGNPLSRHPRRKNAPGSAEEPPCCPLAVSSAGAEPLELLPPTSACLCLWSAWAPRDCVLVELGSVCVGAWSAATKIPRSQDRQQPRAVTSYVALISYRARTVWYWRQSSMIYQVMVHDHHPRGNWRSFRSYRSHPGKHVWRIYIIQILPWQICVKDLDHTDLIQANMCERSRSYRLHQWNMM